MTDFIKVSQIDPLPIDSIMGFSKNMWYSKITCKISLWSTFKISFWSIFEELALIVSPYIRSSKLTRTGSKWNFVCGSKIWIGTWIKILIHCLIENLPSHRFQVSNNFEKWIIFIFDCKINYAFDKIRNDLLPIIEHWK